MLNGDHAKINEGLVKVLIDTTVIARSGVLGDNDSDFVTA